MYRMKHTMTILLIVITSAFLTTAAWSQDAPAASVTQQSEQAKTAKLLQIIQREGLDDAKAAAFENLAVYATPDAIPVLAPLLSDPKLSHYARFALQPIPDAAVDETFRKALDQLSGELLVGVINSIGVRKDRQAVGQLTDRLGDQDPAVVAAAAAALGAIADAPSAASLTKALGDAEDANRQSIARGCLLCAENLDEAGARDDAVRIYDLVRGAKVAESLRMAGLRGAILARQDAGIALMIDQLKGTDTAASNIGLRTAREMGGTDVMAALRDSFSECPPQNAARILLVLGELKDQDALKLVTDAARDAAPQIRRAALKALANVGNAAVLPVVWRAALDADPPVANAATSTLEKLTGEKVDAAIVAHLEGQPADRRLAIELISQRRITAAVPQLLSIAQDAGNELRLPAITALGETVSLDKVPQLVDWVIAAQGQQEQAVTQAALNAACVRMPDRDACAKMLTARLPAAPNDKKTVLLEQLGSMGGPVALQCLADCAADSSADTQDAATRILGTWVGSDVGPVLLDLAKTIQTERYKIRVLRGYIRIASQFGLPHDEKMDMCRKALALAQRDEERDYVLDVLQRDPSPIALELAVSQLDKGGVRNHAANAAVAIAPRAIQDDPKKVVQAMQQVIDSGVGGGTAQRAKTFLERAEKMQ